MTQKLLIDPRIMESDDRLVNQPLGLRYPSEKRKRKRM